MSSHRSAFALATGVGRVPDSWVRSLAFLHLAHGLNNFFVLAPNLTIYNKLIADFTPNTPKYVFKGIAEFATQADFDATLTSAKKIGFAIVNSPDIWRSISVVLKKP